MTNAHSPSLNNNAHLASRSTAAIFAWRSHRKIYSPANAPGGANSRTPAPAAASSQDFAARFSPPAGLLAFPCGSPTRIRSRKNPSRDAREPEIAVPDDRMRRISPPHALSIDRYSWGWDRLACRRAGIHVRPPRRVRTETKTPGAPGYAEPRNHSARQRTRAAGRRAPFLRLPSADSGNGGEPRARKPPDSYRRLARHFPHREPFPQHPDWTARFFRNRRQSECLCLLALRPKPILAGSYQLRAPSSSALSLPAGRTYLWAS